MGRRKKEPKSVHRENIACAAQDLFMKNGIEATSMDDIAKAAGYSKATLYVYFENKEEIVGLLVLESMKKLYAYIAVALEGQETTRARYDYICSGIAQYQEEYPFYFKMALDKINVDFNSGSFLPEEQETYRVGEEINEKIRQFLCDGIARGEIRAELKVLPTIFVFWGMLAGLVQTASNKERYIEKEMKLSKEEFLEYGFDTLYYSITTMEEMYEQ